MNHALRIVRACWRSGLLRIPPSQLPAIARAWWRCGSTYAFLAAVAAIRFPTRVALRDEQGELTFQQLALQAENLAATLPPHNNKPIAVLCRNQRSFVLALLAATRVGADVLTVGTELPPPLLAQILKRQDVGLLLHDPEFIGIDPSIPAQTVQTESLPRQTLPRVCKPGNLVVLTSGTTGISKGIRRRPTLPQVLPILAGLLDQLPFAMHRPLVLAIPLHHGYGLAAVAVALALGAPLHIAPRYDIAPLLAQVKEDALLVTVPTLLVRWLRALDPAEKPALAAIITGSAPLSSAVCTQLIQRLGPILYNLYGSTEAGLIALATPDQLSAAPATVGRPLPGNHVRIQKGNILVTGPLVLAQGWFDTGDLGTIDQAGRLFVSGRADSMFVSGGENVYPHETEELLASHPDIADVAIVVVPDEEFGHRMLAAVVPRENSILDATQLKEWLRARTQPCKLPRSIHPIKSIPRNPLGKLDRLALTKLLADP